MFLIQTKQNTCASLEQELHILLISLFFTKNGFLIERVTEYKYLSIWIDDKLTFNFHIKIGYFYRNKTTLPLFSKKRIIDAVFMSVLDYGDVVYRHASHSCLNLQDSVFHSALRFITGDTYGTHHCVLYGEFGGPLIKKDMPHIGTFLFIKTC